MTDIHNCHERIFTIQPYMMIHFHKLFKLNFFINAIFCGTQVFFCQTLGCMVASTAMYCHYFTSTSSSSLKHPFQELVVSDAMYTIVGHHILSLPLFSSKLFLLYDSRFNYKPDASIQRSKNSAELAGQTLDRLLEFKI